MRAQRYHRFGDPGVLREDDVEEPQPGIDEVVVDVHAASVNPADWKLGAGQAQGLIDINLPFTPGIDFAGVVIAVGAGVDKNLHGRHVYGAELLQRSGTFAEQIAIPACRVAVAPTTISLIEAAAVPLAALTAWKAVHATTEANVQPGQRVLIHGGAGGVGLFAVQFARQRDAHVTVTASTANHSYLKQLGAHHTIDYRQQRFEDQVGDMDVVIDLVGGEVTDRSFNVLREGGTLTSIAAVTPEALAVRRDLAKRRKIRTTVTSLNERRDMNALCRITRLIEEGKLAVVVSNVVALDRVSEALIDNMGGRTRGKTVVLISDHL